MNNFHAIGRRFGARLAALLLVMTAAHVDLAFARGLDLSRESDVRRAVAAYAVEHIRPHSDGFWFSEEAAVRAILFYPQHCRLTKGAMAGRPFVLEPWQAFEIVAPVFGWRCDDGTRRYRRASVWLPRKNGKTELMGGTALQHMLCDGEIGGEGYCVATKEDQAKFVFNAARDMVLLNEDLKRRLRPFRKSIWCDDNISTFRLLGGRAEGTHGMNPSFRIADELHEFRDDRLLQYIDQGMGARRQPMSWDISTAGLQQGYGWELWNTCRQLAEGTIKDERSLVVIYAADPEADPWDPATWAAANPNLGVSFSHANMADAAQRARRSSRHENDFRRYHLNLWVGQVARWLRMEKWNACSAGRPADAWRRDEAALVGRPCFIGVDLASTQDLCAEVLLFPPHGGDPKWRVLCRFWMPAADIEAKVRDQRVPYDVWGDQGALTLTDGDAADHDAIKAQVLQDIERFDVQLIGFDPWNAHKLLVELNEIYPEMAMRVAQTMATMSAPTKLLERLVLKAEIDHGNHPVLRWMADNVATISDTNGNIKPAKNKSTQKIDGIVALIIALALTEASPAGTTPNIDAMVTL